MAPRRKMITATTISTVRVEMPRSGFGPPLKLAIPPPDDSRRRASRGSRPARRRPAPLRRLLLRDEPRFLHEAAVRGLCLLDPLDELRTAHERRIVGTVVHELLPLRRLAHLAEHLD